MANNPMTRKEFYLAKMAGEDVNVPVPQTREETYLKKIAENGGSGGSNVLVVHHDLATHALDKTWKEIHDADYAVITGVSGGDKFVIYIAGFHAGEGKYDVNAYSPYYEEETVGFDWLVFTTDSENGYPQTE